MPINSWLHLTHEDPRHALPASLRRLDAAGGRDCGWVEQMTPFVREHAREIAARDAWILDPFCGFASTLVAASLERVPAVGVELDERRADLARSRLALHDAPMKRYPVIAGSLTDAAVRERVRAGRRFALCLTNVPYFGGPALAADEPAGQLYAASHYATYLESLRDVFNAVHALLEPGGWCVAMVQNLRLGDRFVPLAWDVARLLGERFMLHDDRVIVYDKPADTAPGIAAPTNRAHEIAIVCRKQTMGLDLDRGTALLAALTRDGFAFAVYGSFARRLAGEADVAPNDVDLLCAPDDAEVSRLLQWLEAAGFRIESWNAHVAPPVATAALAYRHYFRARRIDRKGVTEQLDVALAADIATFERSVARSAALMAGGATLRVIT